MDKTLVKLICGFVDRSGGLAKVRLAVDAMKQVSGKDPQGYLTGIAKHRDGSRQLLAAAILGFSLASLVYQENRNKDNV